jgi:hypothetical protein
MFKTLDKDNYAKKRIMIGIAIQSEGLLDYEYLRGLANLKGIGLDFVSTNPLQFQSILIAQNWQTFVQHSALISRYSRAGRLSPGFDS